MDFKPNNICKRVVIFLYTLAIFCIYPIIVDNAYYNITITKTNFFQNSTKVFLVCFIIGILGDVIIHEYFDIEDKFLEESKLKFYKRPVFWMELFVLANVMAWYQTDCSKDALDGSSGRYMGLAMYLIIGLMFIAIANKTRISEISIITFGVASAYTYIIGIIQHLELDVALWETGEKSIFKFMHYRENLSSKQFNIYMSTFGNINIFASFIVISLAMFIGMFVFTDKLYLKLISGTVVVLGGISIMVANSDSAYLGIAGVMFVLLLICYNYGRVKQLVLSVLLLSFGNLIIVLLNKYAVGHYDNRGGVAEALDSVVIAIMAVIMVAALYGMICLVEKCFGSRLAKLNKRRVTIAVIAVTVIVGIIVIFVGNARGMSAFTFDDKWGTYRGFVWSRALEIYRDAPLVNKLFGYGNETFSQYMNAYYYEEMMTIVGELYDNAHNELIQYLITLGLFGMVTYLGLFVTSFIYILKNAKGDCMAYGILAAMTGYFIQSIVNLNQPITTPLYFVLMALGVGYTGYIVKRDA